MIAEHDNWLLINTRSLSGNNLVSLKWYTTIQLFHYHLLRLTIVPSCFLLVNRRVLIDSEMDIFIFMDYIHCTFVCLQITDLIKWLTTTSCDSPIQWLNYWEMDEQQILSLKTQRTGLKSKIIQLTTKIAAALQR